MDAKQLLDNLSSHLKNTIAHAIAVAASFDAPSVTPLHLLSAMAEEKGSLGADIIKKINLTSGAIRNAITGRMSPIEPRRENHGRSRVATLPQLNNQSKHALEKAMLAAYERAHSYVGTEHLLYGLVHCDDADVERLLAEAACDHDMLDTHLENAFAGTSRFPDMDDAEDVLDHMHHMMEEAEDAAAALSARKENAGNKTSRKEAAQKKQPSALDMFAINLTAKDMQDRIDPVIGREREIGRVMHILCRRTKNNPVLIGEPGVGKTAIVEGLAKRIAEGTAPDALKRKKILSLDVTLLLAGTIYRGEFEARLRQIIDEISRDPDAIVFIDEIHNLIGAGSNAGSMDAANILKPALARGLLRCIGATTHDEYQKHIKTDPAFERRLQSVVVEEPTAEETMRILHGVKPYYEQFHRASIGDDAVEAAARLGEKYIHDNFLPDKAIDLLDEASAMVRARLGMRKSEHDLFALEQELERLTQEKEQAIAKESFNDAMRWKAACEGVEKRIAAQKELVKKTAGRQRARVTAGHIAEVLGDRLAMDPALFLESDWERVNTISDRMKRRIVGQDAALDAIADALRRAYLLPARSRRPFASFLFAGPSGMGKTETAKALAQELFHDDKSLIAFDMSEFAEAHSISKILGSPAGYVGYNERNRFTDELRRRPGSVVLFDEFDKAHPDVRRLLLQILDEGGITDSHGKKISFSHAIVVLTTNTGAEAFKSSGIGFGGSAAQAKETTERSVRERLKEEFGADLLGRLHSTLLFHPLKREHIAQIVRNHIDAIHTHLTRTKQVGIRADDEALASLAKDAYSPDFGARNIERAVEDTIHGLLARALAKETRKKSYLLKKTAHAYRLV